MPKKINKKEKTDAKDSFSVNHIPDYYIYKGMVYYKKEEFDEVVKLHEEALERENEVSWWDICFKLFIIGLVMYWIVIILMLPDGSIGIRPKNITPIASSTLDTFQSSNEKTEIEIQTIWTTYWNEEYDKEKKWCAAHTIKNLTYREYSGCLDILKNSTTTVVI